MNFQIPILGSNAVKEAKNFRSHENPNFWMFSQSQFYMLAKLGVFFVYRNGPIVSMLAYTRLNAVKEAKNFHSHENSNFWMFSQSQFYMSL